MDDFFEDAPLPLTDEQVAAGALPGESWAQARKRLEAANWAAFRHSELSGLEWERVVELIEAIQDVCVETLHHWCGDLIHSSYSRLDSGFVEPSDDQSNR